MSSILISCQKCRAQLRVNLALYQVGDVATCPHCKNLNTQPFEEVKVTPEKEPKPKQANPDDTLYAQGQGEIGWIIVHDEQAVIQTHPLKIGINVIGRKPQEPMLAKPDIPIETNDMRMSKRHGIIEVLPKPTGGYHYKLYDVGKLDPKCSLNGIYVNALAQRLKTQFEGRPFFEQIFLKDGDLIQLGRTKIRLKTPEFVQNARQAEDTIVSQDFGKTIYM
jgi:FHA domain